MDDASQASGIAFEIPINEGGTVNIIARKGTTEIEIIGNLSRVGDTIKLEAVHFTKNAGQRLSYSQLREFAREFGRQQGAREVVIQVAIRTTGKTAGQTPRPITVKVD